MTTEFTPPYRAHRTAGGWYVINAAGGLEYQAAGHEDAEREAAEMNRKAQRHDPLPSYGQFTRRY